MATTTAQILVGRPHPNDGGITSFHTIHFMEGDRPSLVLNDLINPNDDIVIIPTIENTIEDILLVILVYIFKNNELCRKIVSLKYVELYQILNDHERIEVYNKVENFLNGMSFKVVFNILDHSHLNNVIDKIKKYQIDFEVTQTTIKREYNKWSNKYDEKGI